MKNRNFLTTVLLMALVFALAFMSCDNGTTSGGGGEGSGGSGDDTTTYNIGDTGPGGGIVFYIDLSGFTMTDTGKKACYLESAPADMDSLTWATTAFFDTSIFGTSEAIGTGRKNTALILATDANAPAAKVCKDHRGPNNKDDWFLPSVDELEKLYDKKDVVGGFAEDYNYIEFWSSSEWTDKMASSLDFDSGIGYATSKHLSLHVRPIRAF